MRRSIFRASRFWARLSSVAVCLSSGFLFIDSWHLHRPSTLIHGVVFTLAVLLMLGAILLIKER